MRTSLNQQIRNTQSYLSLSSSRLTALQSQAASGKRIQKASDDVSGTSRALSLRAAISNTRQLADNITVTQPMVDASANAIGDLVTLVRSARDIAVSATKPDYTGTAAETNVTQLNNILDQMADLANTKYMDQYVFSGTKTNTAPLAEQAGSPPYAYQGNSSYKQTQVLGWVSLTVNVPGNKLFNFDGSAGAGTTDLFTMVTQLRDAIQSGDEDLISAQLDNIDANYDNLLAAEANLGSVSARMDNASTMISETTDRLRTLLSETEDIDLVQATIDLAAQQNVYKAALAVTQQVLSLALTSAQTLG